MITPAVTPQTPQQDPFAEFGGIAVSIPSGSVPASTPAAKDPFAEFGGIAVTKTPPAGVTHAEQGTLAANIAASATPAGANPLTAGVVKGTAETLHTLGAAAGHLMPNSWRDTLGLPSSFKEPDYLQSTNGAETAGEVAENIAEFAMGDEALKGLQISQRLGIASKLAQMAKSSPYIARMLELGMNAGRGGAVTVPQQMLHGATPTEALKTGAEATLLGAGTGAAVEGASALAESPAGQAVKNLIKGGQPKLQTAIREAAQSGADVAAARPSIEVTADTGGEPGEHVTKTVGKTVPGAPAAKVTPTAGMRTVLQDVSNDIESRGKSIYQALDEATDNKFTTYTERLNKINDRLDTLIPDTTEADDSAIERLEQQKSEIETSQAQLFEDLKTQGIDPDLVDEAKAHWRQAQALKDVQNALATSTKGNVAHGATEVVNPDQFVTRLEKLNRVPNKGVPSRLEQALGSKQAADALVKDAYEAVKAKQYKTVAKWAGGIAGGLMAGSGLLDWRLHNLANAAATAATIAP